MDVVLPDDSIPLLGGCSLRDPLSHYLGLELVTGITRKQDSEIVKEEGVDKPFCLGQTEINLFILFFLSTGLKKNEQGSCKARASQKLWTRTWLTSTWSTAPSSCHSWSPIPTSLTPNCTHWSCTSSWWHLSWPTGEKRGLCSNQEQGQAVGSQKRS